MNVVSLKIESVLVKFDDGGIYRYKEFYGWQNYYGSYSVPGEVAAALSKAYQEAKERGMKPE
jgi:hypothetical protein